jgi:hypothetical protein
MNPETAVVVDRFWSKVDKSGPCWLWTGALSEHGPPENRVTFRVSATKLKRFLQCPRSYFLRYVQGVEEDVKGSYLIVGNAFDQAVQHYLSQGARGVASIDPKIVRMLGAARPLLPDPGTVEVQHEYSVSHPDGFVVEGKPDLRRVGDGRAWIGDTKTCASREWALTPGTLRTNEQALLYAWCELEAGNLGPVNATWTYVTKATKPEAWNVTALLSRGEVYAWFDAVVRPAVAAMRLAAAEYDADRVVANLDSCERCWVKAHCSPYDGPNSYDGLDSGVSLVQLKGRRPVSPAQKEGSSLAFDLKQLSEQAVDLVPALEASLATPATAEENAMRVRAVLDAAAPIAINPPPVRARKPARTPTETPAQSSLEDLASELQTVVDTCQTAIARVDRLLAALRGKGAA